MDLTDKVKPWIYCTQVEPSCHLSSSTFSLFLILMGKLTLYNTLYIPYHQWQCPLPSVNNFRDIIHPSIQIHPDPHDSWNNQSEKGLQQSLKSPFFCLIHFILRCEYIVKPNNTIQQLLRLDSLQSASVTIPSILIPPPKRKNKKIKRNVILCYRYPPNQKEENPTISHPNLTMFNVLYFRILVPA